MKINWTLIVGLAGLVLSGGVGYGAWTAGYAIGKQSAVDVQREFFQARVGQPGQFGPGGNATQGQRGAAQTDPTGQTTQTDPAGQTGQAGRGQLGRLAAAGIVKSVTGNKIEVTMPNGTVVTVNIDSQTQIIKTVTGQASDIQAGMRVNVTSDQTGNNVTGRLITVQAAGTPQSP